jgi:uncharacterized protein (DUF983 family)
MSISAPKRTFLVDLFKERCPHCREGFVFKQDVNLFQLPVMNDQCDKCNYRFDREPGYFLGAMYLSYGFAVLQGIITYFLCQAINPSISVFWSILWVMFIILICGRKNYKLSRILYIYIFPW